MTKNHKTKKSKNLLQQVMDLKRHLNWQQEHSQHEGPRRAAVVPSKKVYKRDRAGNQLPDEG